MINLSKEQKKIIEQDLNQSVQVLASAGTGKTRVLTERVRHILNHTKKEGIIALTFTNKSAEEMKTRLDNSDSAIGRCWIATIHSVAQRIVEQYGHTIGLPSNLNIYDRDQDRKTIFLQSLTNNSFSIEDLMQDNKGLDNKKVREQTIQKYMDNFSKIKRNLMTSAEIKKEYGEKVLYVFQNYHKELKTSGGIDFDDILVYAHRILIEQPGCVRIYGTKYRYIFVDEAQDLNKAQYELIKALSGYKNQTVMMVGDPDQMIYGFNGSSKNYLCQNFIQDFSPLTFKLKKNYRSSKIVVRLANKLKPNSQVESDFALKGKYKIKDLDDETLEAEWILQKIKEILNTQNHPDIEGPISLNNMVVIARNRFVFQELEKTLKKDKINYWFKKSKPLLEPESRIGKVLDLSLRLKLNPRDWISGKKLYSLLAVSFPNQWPEGLSVTTLVESLDPSSISFIDLIKKTLRGIENLDIENPNMLKLFSSINKDIQKELNLLKNNHSATNSIAEKKWESLLQELEIFKKDMDELKKYWRLFRLKKSETSLLAFKNSLSLGELIPKDTESMHAPALILSTVHTMKGLEKDIVFLIGMCEGVFPDYRAKSLHEIEEEKNNAFVAVTRSRRWIYITYPKNRKMPWGDIKSQQESRFVSEMKNTQSLQAIKLRKFV